MMSDEHPLNDLEVRQATANDVDDWLVCRSLVYTGIDESFHRKEIELMLGAHDKACFLASFPSRTSMSPHATIGMIELSLRNVVDGCLSSPVGYVEGIYVAPDYRGLGVSRLLMQQAEDWCRDCGCQEMATDAELNNVDAQRFHERCGFRETYRIVEYRKSL